MRLNQAIANREAGYAGKDQIHCFADGAEFQECEEHEKGANKQSAIYDSNSFLGKIEMEVHLASMSAEQLRKLDPFHDDWPHW